MEESSVYQAIIEKGKIRGAREMLLKLARRHLGDPDDATQQTVESIADADQLANLVERLGQVATWEELLASPTPKRSRKRRSS